LQLDEPFSDSQVVENGAGEEEISQIERGRERARQRGRESEV